jgi:hypothetical protein
MKKWILAIALSLILSTVVYGQVTLTINGIPQSSGQVVVTTGVTPPLPATCVYTYSAWGTCQSNGTQTRTVVSAMPFGCTGTPILSQSCTPTPVGGTWVKVADNWGLFTTSATTLIRFGSGSTWAQKSVAPGTEQCSWMVVGKDPAPGTSEECDAWTGTTPPVPIPTIQTLMNFISGTPNIGVLSSMSVPGSSVQYYINLPKSLVARPDIFRPALLEGQNYQNLAVYVSWDNYDDQFSIQVQAPDGTVVNGVTEEALQSTGFQPALPGRYLVTVKYIKGDSGPQSYRVNWGANPSPLQSELSQ